MLINLKVINNLMDKLKIANIISTFTNPPIITIPLFMLICIILSFENGVFNIPKFIVMEIISLIFASVLPMAIILFWAKKLNTDKDISNRQDRFTPLIVGIISYFIGFLISLMLDVDKFLSILLLCYSINTGVVLLITAKWKISVHTTGLSGPVGALILLIGPFGAIFGVLYPILIWSRVTLNKHTLSQAICGGVQGFFLTIIEFYLFAIIIFKLDISQYVPLLICIYLILAIIYTPVLLGILSYSNIKNKRLIFIIFEIIALGLFLAFTPSGVFAIFVLISLTSILISIYAGDDFSWFKVIKSS